MTVATEMQPRGRGETLVLTYYTAMMRRDWLAFRSIWHDEAVQEIPFQPEGLGDFISASFVGVEEIYAHYMRALENRRDHIFWIDALHRTTDPSCFIVESRARSIIGETDTLYENTYVTVFTLREGKIGRLKEFMNPLPVMRAFEGAFEDQE